MVIGSRTNLINPMKSYISKAINTAAQAELVIYIGGTSHEHGSDCEGYDKPNLKLPYQQDRLLKGILEVNPNTVVVLISGGPVEIGEWYNDATALLHGSFLGMEGGKCTGTYIVWRSQSFGEN